MGTFRELEADRRTNPKRNNLAHRFRETQTGSSIDVDVGLKHFAVLSDGMVYQNDCYFRSLEKNLAREQRKLSRRQRMALDKKAKLSEARNYQNQKRKVARIHEKIVKKRNDFLRKVSTVRSDHSGSFISKQNIGGGSSNVSPITKSF